ncbi:DNA polymerase III subunit psi [Pasteurellaceae bacterium Macca]|nr:DNA polymerase III subunit psi [Pasteurellaceae bacterium Macca]
MNRYDLLLHEMNIPQWVLSKPQVLKGDGQIRLAERVKLVIVSEENRQTSGLFQDIICTLALRSDEFQWFTLEQSLRLAFTHSPIFWLIQGSENRQQFTKKWKNQTAWYNENWAELQKSAQKRQLWQQMQPFCQHFEDNA